MKKKSIYKKLFCLLLSVGCIAQLAGCGKGTDGKQENQGSSKDYVYVAEYQSIEAEDISTTVISGDTIFFTEDVYNEEKDEYKQAICSVKIGETKPTELPIEIAENNFVNSLSVDSEGNLLVILNVNEGEGENMKSAYFLKHYKTDGTELISQDITSLGDGMEYFYVQYVVTDAEGNIYLSAGENDIFILDKDGNQKGKITSENWINSLVMLPNGKAGISYWGNEGGCVMAEIDAASNSLGKIYKNLPDASNGFAKADEDVLFVMNGSAVYKYDMNAETYEEEINWINCDINGDYVQSVSVLDDGRLLAVYRDWSSEETKTEFVYLVKKDASEVTEKTTITYGALYVDQTVKQNIINFNKTNEKYRIEVKEYATEDWETGVTQMNNEITSGAGPDIIDFSAGNVDMYIAKGILEDLNPYIEAAGIKKEDYVENAFNAYAEGDKLYGIVPTFGVLTVMGKTSDVGEKQGWTIDDVMSLMESKQEGTELFNYCSKDSILYYMCNMSLDSFINWETGECKFNDGYFEKVLEFANQFPKEVEYNEEGESVPSKIQSGKLLLQEIDVSDMKNYQMYSMIFGEPTTFIGFPSNGGTGSYITASNAMGINVKSENKDGAWDFIKTFIEEDYQKNSVEWYFPVLRSALDAQFEEAMTPEYTEIDGEKVEQPKTTWGWDDFEAEIYAAKQEEVDAVKALIESADGVVSNNEEISNIIAEEAAAYFEGQKSAKDVADVIQSRVQIYVNENR